MKNINQLKSIVLLAILNVYSYGYANEHNNETNNEENNQAQEKEVESEIKPQYESTETFIPTETISEDLSVPFPVDI